MEDVEALLSDHQAITLEENNMEFNFAEFECMIWQ